MFRLIGEFFQQPLGRIFNFFFNFFLKFWSNGLRPSEMRRRKYVFDSDLRESTNFRANPRDTLEDTIEWRNDNDRFSVTKLAKQRFNDVALVAVHDTCGIR